MKIEGGLLPAFDQTYKNLRFLDISANNQKTGHPHHITRKSVLSRSHVADSDIYVPLLRNQVPFFFVTRQWADANDRRAHPLVVRVARSRGATLESPARRRWSVEGRVVSRGCEHL